MEMTLIAVANHSLPSKRKYKMKLKEWNLDKNLSATDMKVILAIASDRAAREGKETVFYNGGQELSAEKIENFKKRMHSNREGMASPNASKKFLMLSNANT
jgi:hypothetical protein